MSAEADARSAGRWGRVWSVLRGPRFIDLPIRVLALIMGLTVLIPGSFESDELLYSVLLVFAYALLALSPYLPLTMAMTSTVFGVAYLFVYPDFENMFPEALILSAAVLLSYFRWWSFALATAGLLACLVAATRLDAYDAGLPGFIDLGYGWLMSSLLGLAAGIIERRIRREIDRRETAAREHERALEAMRQRFTSDAHDTISHSLCTESAIIRALGRAPYGPGSERMIAELAMVNAEASKRLRQLIGRLRSDAPDTSRVDLRAEATLITTAIEDGAAAGGVHLSTTVGPLPVHASRDIGEHFTAFILELATNVIRYSTPGTESRLEVTAQPLVPGRAELRYVSVNESEDGLSLPPRSLRERAAALGGSCRADSADGRVRVVVTHPLDLLDGETLAEVVGADGAGRDLAGANGVEEAESGRYAATAAEDESPADHSLSDRSLSDQSLSDRSLSDQSLSDRSLSDQSLSDRSLSDSARCASRLDGRRT